MHDRVFNQTGSHDSSAATPSDPSLWEIAWRRKGHILLGAIIGLVLGVLYWSMAAKTYESTAQILVMQKRPDKPISTAGTPSAPDVRAASDEDYLDTHRGVLRSAVILDDAFRKGSLGERETFRDSQWPLRDLKEALIVERDHDKNDGRKAKNKILNVSFRCRHAEDCGLVLEAVIDSYRDYLNQDMKSAANNTLNLIQKARDLVQNDLEAKEKAYAEFRRDTPALWKTQYGTTMYQERLGNIDAQRSALKVRAKWITSTLVAAEEANKQGRSRMELLNILSSSPGHSQTLARKQTLGKRRNTAEANDGDVPVEMGSVSLEQELLQLQLEEGKLLADYGPRHPQVRTVRNRIQTIQGLLASASASPTKIIEANGHDEQTQGNLVELRTTQLKQELGQARRGLEALNTLYDLELREAQKVFPYEIKENAFLKSIQRDQQIFHNILKQLEDLHLVGGLGGFDARVITPPTEAEKVSPRGSLVLPMALLLGLLLGGGLALLVEMTDKSFRSAEDIRLRLGLPIIGLIPRIKCETKSSHAGEPSEAQLDAHLCTWHRIASSEAEAYRGVRTALYFSTRGQGRKVIQVTSPNQGDGKSTLSSNLSVCMAQAGKRVLLVDADMRRPSIAKLFGIHQPHGFAEVLSGLTEINEAIYDTVVPGLSVLPSGLLPPNPAELLTGSRLREALEWMRERYDYVVVDTPPLLAVTDPSVVASQVDGVLVALRPAKNGRVEAERAKDILDNLNVPIFGIVLNAMERMRNSSKYGYKGYKYHEEDAIWAARNGDNRRVRAVHVEDADADRQGNGKPISNS